MAKEATTIAAVLRRHTLRTALVPLLVVELGLLLLYAIIGGQVVGQWRQELLTTLERNLHQSSEGQARQLDVELAAVTTSTAQLRAVTEGVFRGTMTSGLPFDRSRYRTADNGVLYQPVDDGGASIYYAATTELTDRAWDTIERTEPLDPILASIVEASPQVVAAYLNTPDDFNRYFPFIPDAAAQYPPDLDMEKFNFFYAADGAQNPDGEVVWTDAYFDPAGAGWMISSVAPVYVGDRLEAVVGLDVTIERLASSALQLDLPYPGAALLLSPQGAILGVNHAAAELFPAGRELIAAKEVGIQGDERRLDAEATLSDLLDDAAAADRMVASMAARKGDFELTIGEEDFVVSYADVASTGWRLAVLVRRADATGPATTLAAETRKVGISIIVSLALFYGAFFYVIYRRSRALAERVSRPLIELTEATRRQGEGSELRATHIHEIDTLHEGFHEMVTAIRRHREAIEGANEELERQVDAAERRARARDRVLTAQAQRAAMGEMVASIAHHWRQPLATLQLLVDEIGMTLRETSGSADAFAPLLADADSTMESMNRTIEMFNRIYAAQGDAAPMTLSSVVEIALTLSDGAMKEAGIDVVHRSLPAPDVHVPRGEELAQIVVQLLSVGRHLVVAEGEARRLSVAERVSDSFAEVALVAHVSSPARLPTVDGAEIDFEGPQDAVTVGLFAAHAIAVRRGGTLLIETTEEGPRFVLREQRREGDGASSSGSGRP